MNELSEKILKYLPGKAVRKDLTSLMKKGANVPTFVLEYLLGMYCSTDDEKVIETGFAKIKQILTENYVRPDQSEFIKSRIRESGEYTIIDKILVELHEREDKYIARFTNLNIAPFEVSPNLVIHNEKLLLGGIWCIVKISYTKMGDDNVDESDEEFDFGDVFRTRHKNKKKSKFDSPFNIVSLKPIQMPNLNEADIIDIRKHFTTDEWITMLLRSAGYEPKELAQKQKLHYLLRFVPLIQKNYNLVELGPRGTGKSHVYSELSPYSILISSGHTSSANMFYHLARRKVGLVGNWDCVAFDEVGGMRSMDNDTLQTMKNYMANGSFARGTDSINADASIVFVGNTFRTVQDMLRTATLFEPFPNEMNNDSAFFDRIHAYLPGWETPKLRSALFTKDYGLISDTLSEFAHIMRKYDFTNEFAQYFELNKNFNTRDEIAVRKTFSGLMKLIYPDENITKNEVRELLEYAIENRRRVKEQLNKMTPIEFKDVGLGYIDRENREEFIVGVPEQAARTLVFGGLELPGYVYAVGKSHNNNISVYRLENKLLPGTGLLPMKNIEGLPSHARKFTSSINAAFNYYKTNVQKIINAPIDDYDYSLYFNDLQNKGISDEVSVALVIGFCSAIANRPVLNGLIVVGRVVMSGSMMPLTTNLLDILSAAKTAGAKQILLPIDSEERYIELPYSVKKNIIAHFYSSPIEAARIALGIEQGNM